MVAVAGAQAGKDYEKVWPEIDKTLTDKNFGILLYDVY